MGNIENRNRSEEGVISLFVQMYSLHLSILSFLQTIEISGCCMSLIHFAYRSRNYLCFSHKHWTNSKSRFSKIRKNLLHVKKILFRSKISCLFPNFLNQAWLVHKLSMKDKFVTNGISCSFKIHVEMKIIPGSNTAFKGKGEAPE